MLNLAGAAVYGVVALLAARAAWRGGRGHRWHWLAIALVFAALAGWRLAHGEALVQGWARAMLYDNGTYVARHAWQAPAAAVLLLAGFVALALIALRRGVEPLRRWSALATVGLCGLSVLRLLSFHGLDALLQAGAGPFRVNHAIDLGLAGMAGACALIAGCRGLRPQRGPCSGQRHRV